MPQDPRSHPASRRTHLPPVDADHEAVLERGRNIERAARGVEPVRPTQQPGLGLGLVVAVVLFALLSLIVVRFIAAMGG